MAHPYSPIQEGFAYGATTTLESGRYITETHYKSLRSEMPKQLNLFD